MESPLLLTLLNLGTTLVMAVQVNFYFNSVFGREKSRRDKKYWAAAFLPLTFLYLTFELSDLASSAAALAIIFLYAQGYGVSQKLKAMFAILYAVLLTFVNLILVYLLHPSLQPSDPEPAGLSERILLATTLPIGCMIMFAVIQAIRLVAKRRRFPLESRYSLLFLCVPLISIYLVNVLTVYGEKNVHYFLSVFGFIVLNVLVVYMLDTLIARFRLTLQNDRLQSQMDYQDANYEKTVHSFKEIKRIIHDTNKHLLVAAEYIERGRSEEAREHIKTTLSEIDNAYRRVNTGNLVVDALVTNALNVAGASGIRVDTELGLREPELPIERYDLCVVLGNMLDNAVEASKLVRVAEDRHIRVQIRSSEAALFIRVRNRTEREVDDLRSRKEDPDNHGFGLTNIERICDKYGGHMTIETDNRMFDNMVMLPFPE
ncbi:sensor histidine kinase [Saccharibacillus alkalitolerans]|uniref:GHKL domain-containing protein n=1 Tax=Saccharibacillus alkalitolerans TaxID=2705290 RepID=A0ABX0FDR2_9BACL|nr:sensor histidine kinase [Saccharibacillus alkalitolerans]NGZ77954.1 GHKL domain-containing protein [Saccharibacillus alkalitolerans]